MKHKINLFLLVMIGCINAHAFTLDSESSDVVVPVRYISQDETGITVSYKFQGAVAIPDDIYKGYFRLDIPGFGHNNVLEEPAYPVRTDTYEIPDGCNPKITILSESWKNLNLSLSPARPLLIDGDSEFYTKANVPAIKNYAASLPSSTVFASDLQIYRDRKFYMCLLYP